jgi:hypothetical protein
VLKAIPSLCELSLIRFTFTWTYTFSPSPTSASKPPAQGHPSKPVQSLALPPTLAHHSPSYKECNSKHGLWRPLNLSTLLIVTLVALEHAPIIIEDLSWDVIESRSALLNQRIPSTSRALPPLASTGKHTLTEQNMGSYEGPLPTAGLLANANDGLGGVRVGAEQWVEEVVINEAMEMNSVDPHRCPPCHPHRPRSA